MKRRVLSMALAAVLCLGLVPSALAAGQTFSDVPETYWGYADIEAVAEAGLMNGTGNGEFSPEMKVSVAQFLTLLGRLVFPEITVGTNDTWYGPYVEAAQTNGLLAGTQVNVNDVEAEISRYDMAVILRAAGKQLGVAEKAAQSGEVTDYGEIPTKYAEAVLAVYGMGLIRGDQAGNFNGSNTMMRAEVATVIMRLAKAKPGSSQGEATEPTASPEPSATTEPEKPTESQAPTNPDDDWKFAFARKYVPSPYDPDEVKLKEGERIHIYRDFMALNAWGKRNNVYLHVGDTLQLTVDTVPAGYGYTKDDAQWYSDDESVATVDENGLITAVGEGQARIGATVPVIYYGEIMIPQQDHFMLYCEK